MRRSGRRRCSQSVKRSFEFGIEHCDECFDCGRLAGIEAGRTDQFPQLVDGEVADSFQIRARQPFEDSQAILPLPSMKCSA